MIALPKVRVAVLDDDRDTASSVASNLSERGLLCFASSSPQAEAEAQAEAQRRSQARTALLGMVSRELRAPLQTMLANVELLAVRSPQDGTVDIIERLMRCIELMSGQLDNIAHYTRLASGSMEIRCERFIVLDLLRRVVEEHASAAKANHQVITLDAPRGADVTIHGDPIRLHQVINNYLTNAITCAGPGRISVVVRLLSHQFGDLSLADAVEVLVEDEGPGISDAESAALWEPFARGDSISRSRRGSGLGLAVVKLLAASVGWDVGVRSEPGHCATFYVVLPLIGANPASPPLPPPAGAS
jgi:signal transduction histidine kinase